MTEKWKECFYHINKYCTNGANEFDGLCSPEACPLCLSNLKNIWTDKLIKDMYEYFGWVENDR